jgi:hypothetical protein
MWGVIVKKHTTLTYRGDKLSERYQDIKKIPQEKNTPRGFLILINILNLIF